MLGETVSEFADEYQDWLEGGPLSRGSWFDTPLDELETRPILQVTPDTRLDAVVRLMDEHGKGAVLVTENDRLLGIFTERDVLRRVVRAGLDVKSVAVREVMTESPDVMPSRATLAQALRMMSSSAYRHLPIVDASGHVEGLVSMRSIIHFVCERFCNQVLNAPPETQRISVLPEGG